MLSLLATTCLAAQPPNIVIVLADDLGYGDLGCYGQQRIRTPHLDRLAAEGLRFTSHYAGAPLCAPSRCVLMTGRHTGHAAVRDNGGPQTLSAEEPILPEVLRSAGYATYATGKWGLGAVGNAGDPMQRGWGGFLGFYDQGKAHHHWPTSWVRDGRDEALPGNADRAHGAYAPDLMADAADAFIRAQAKGPFLLYLATTLPHAEISAPDDAVAAYRGQFPEKPFAGGGSYGACTEPNATRAAMISRLDAHVGRLRATLEELGLAQRTLVLFLSDNGPATAGGSDPRFFASSGPLKGNKFSLDEGGIRTPAIAWWPGTIRPAICDLPSAHDDWLPTCAELAGAPAPAGIDGVSLAPTLLGAGQQAQRSHLYWEHRDSQAVRAGPLKLIRTVSSGAVRLYDLAVDIAEAKDLASQRPDDVARLVALMDGSHVDHPGYPLGVRAKR